MKLAFQLYQCAPSSGRQRSLRFLLDQLEQRGHACRVYSTSPRSEPFSESQWHHIKRAVPGSRRQEQRFLARVKADITADPVDLVVGFDPAPNLDVYLALDAPVPDVAAALHGRFHRFSAAYRLRAERESAIFVPTAKAHILLGSAAHLDRYRERYNTPAERLHLLSAGLGPDRQAPEKAAERRKTVRAELGLDSQEYAPLFISDSFVRGGLEQAITSLAKIREEQPSIKSRLLVVGAEKPGRFRACAKRAGVADSVEFLGARDDIVDLMLAADLLVYPAGLPVIGTVLLEALTIGLPLVVSDACGHAHHVSAARSGIVLPAPVVQEDLDRAMMRYLDGIFRADCRESAQLYARLTEMDALYREAADLLEQFTAHRE